MNLVVTLEYRFDRTPDGVVWTQTTFPYRFWTRYLSVFDSVRVVARTRDVPDIPDQWKQASGERVVFTAVPDYLGPWQYVLHARHAKRTIKNSVSQNDAVLMRVPSNIASILASLPGMRGRPYGVEVVGDPYGFFASGAVRHPLRPFFRWWFCSQLRRLCARACAAAYVTKYALQDRYPPAADGFATHYSSVDLSEDDFVSLPRPLRARPGRLTLVTVGSMAQLYKATDALIDAVYSCLQRGLDIDLVVVGDGKYRPELESRAATLNLKERVRFLGQLPAGEAVRTQLDQADLFVLPSRSEGLPRAMIEAMARGKPCIGTTAGGIPELLSAEDLVPPGDVAALANKICQVVSDPERMIRMGRRNLEKAKEYCEDTLRERRITFYRYLRRRTEEWQKANKIA